MKNNYFNKIAFVIIALLCFVVMLVFFFGIVLQGRGVFEYPLIYRVLLGISILLILAILNAILQIKINGQASKWLFKYRFWVKGLLTSIYLFFVLTSMSYLGIFSRDTYYSKFIFYQFVIMVIIMSLILIPVNYWGFKSLRKKTILETKSGEIEILTDSATIMNEGKRIAGRFILTSFRLCFISVGKQKIRFDFNLAELKQGIELSRIKRFRTPNGLFIPDKDVRIILDFSAYWRNEIMKLMNK